MRRRGERGLVGPSFLGKRTLSGDSDLRSVPVDRAGPAWSTGQGTQRLLYIRYANPPTKNPVEPQSVKLPVFNCPSQTFVSNGGGAANFTYCGNIGTQGVYQGTVRVRSQHDGFMSLHGIRGESDPRITYGNITDGASNTAAYSEFIIDGAGTPEKQKVKTWTGDQWAQTPQQLRESCVNMPLSALSGRQGMRGSSWAWSFQGVGQYYTHTMAPNDQPCHIANGGSDWMGDTLMSASSQHVGGVHVLMGDGAVRFISDNINRNTWLAIGSRSGNETVGEF